MISTYTLEVEVIKTDIGSDQAFEDYLFDLSEKISAQGLTRKVTLRGPHGMCQTFN